MQRGELNTQQTILKTEVEQALEVHHCAVVSGTAKSNLSGHVPAWDCSIIGQWQIMAITSG